MNVTLTWTITSVIAVCAIVSPILTAIVNNRHQRKMKLIEIEQDRYTESVLHRRKLFEAFLNSAAEAAISDDGGPILAMMQNYYQLMPYIPKNRYPNFGAYVKRILNNEEAPKHDLDFDLVIETYRDLLEEEKSHAATYQQNVWHIKNK